jgi:Zn-dependent protease
MRFSLAGFPIDVHWSFLLVAALLGLGSNDLRIIVTWVGIVFVSVLFHELGHAVVARRYGLSPEISLYGMGGLTTYRTGRRLSRARSIFVSLAGPGAGLLLGGVVWGITQIPMPELNPIGRIALLNLLFVNIAWSILNLLPILPLDGGSVMRSLVHMIRGNADDRLPRQISVAVAAAGGVAGFMTGNTFAAIFAGYLALINYQALRGMPMPVFPGMRR